MGKIKDWIRKQSKFHFVDGTALLLATNPIYSAFETTVAGMSDDVSIRARLIVTGITYLGMGSLFSRGRDLSRRLFKISDETRERIQVLHDIGYAAVLNAVMAPPIYLTSGANGKEALVGGAIATVFGATMGPWMGYSIDVARDLTGLGNCERNLYPDLVRRQRPGVKKGLATILAAGSLAINAGIYALTPDEEADTYEPVAQQISYEGSGR